MSRNFKLNVVSSILSFTGYSIIWYIYGTTTLLCMLALGLSMLLQIKKYTGK